MMNLRIVQQFLHQSRIERAKKLTMSKKNNQQEANDQKKMSEEQPVDKKFDLEDTMHMKNAVHDIPTSLAVSEPPNSPKNLQCNNT